MQTEFPDAYSGLLNPRADFFSASSRASVFHEPPSTLTKHMPHAGPPRSFNTKLGSPVRDVPRLPPSLPPCGQELQHKEDELRELAQQELGSQLSRLAEQVKALTSARGSLETQLSEALQKAVEARAALDGAKEQLGALQTERDDAVGGRRRSGSASFFWFFFLPQTRAMHPAKPYR